ncbi:signal peptidase complex catalytic subunit SEC11A-like [Branchiostoma floridae x Branchiostoma japonicum]
MAIPVHGAVAVRHVPNPQQERRRPRQLTSDEMWGCVQQLSMLNVLWNIWIFLQLWTNCETPLMTLGNRYGSMAPTLSSGDLLFITNFQDDPIGVGDIVSAKVPGNENKTPLMRRVAEVTEDEGGNPRYLTRGDNVDNMFPMNDTTDPVPTSPFWVSRDDIVGKMTMNIPLLGIPSLPLVSDSPALAPLQYLVWAFIYFYFGILVVGAIIAAYLLLLELEENE